MLFGGFGPTVLFTLPSIQLPDVMAGIHLLGVVSAEALLAAFYDGLRLATMIICVGAANSLANPSGCSPPCHPRCTRSAPCWWSACRVFPQLAEIGRPGAAGQGACAPAGSAGRKALRGIVIPVLADALDRSLLLAAAMDSRGYGRRADVPRAATGADLDAADRRASSGCASASTASWTAPRRATSACR